MRLAAITATALIALAGNAQAHDIWLTPGPTGGVLVHYGHPHEPEMPSADKLTSLSAYEPGRVVPLAAKAEPGAMPVLKAAYDGEALVAASYDNGYWVRLAESGYRNASERLYPQAEKSLWSVKFAKAVLGPSAPWDRVLEQPLEIVPLEAPTAASGKIRVKVLFEGRPLAGTSVVATDGANFKTEADQARAATDADGVAVVPLRAAGPQVLDVSHHVSPSQTPTLADADSYSATFSFTVSDPKTN